jgi:hypothetical protein
MSTGPQGWHSGAGEFEGLPELGRVRVATPLPSTILWRWRYEIGAAASVSLIWWSCAVEAGGLAALTLITALLALVAAVKPLRRLVFAAAWSVITPHRVRLACAEAGVVSPRGKLPAVLFTRRESYGERVYLWCPSGLCANDVSAARRAIAVICWATEVRVLESTGQYPPLVVLEVDRQPARVASERRALEHRSGPALRNRYDRHAGRPSTTPGAPIW